MTTDPRLIAISSLSRRAAGVDPRSETLGGLVEAKRFEVDLKGLILIPFLLSDRLSTGLRLMADASSEQL